MTNLGTDSENVAKSSLPESGTGRLLAAYFADVAAGKLAEDAAQIAVAQRLDACLATLSARQHGLRRIYASIGEFFARRRRRPREPSEPSESDSRAIKTLPRSSLSIYIYGTVGRGKSMLMDYFFALAPEPRKRRVHFHQFMAEIFAELERIRATPGATEREDPLLSVCRNLARQTRLLCFDEFVVTSIAEAMILGRLIGSMLDFGVVVVATSNFHPKDLYQGGLHRDRFLPFIAMISARCQIVQLQGTIDWRVREAAQSGRSLPHWLLLDDNAAFQQIWQQKCGGFAESNQKLSVLGREITVPKSGSAAGHAVAYFGFADLCGANLGANDYLAITAAYRTIFIDNIPILSPNQSEAARRFLTLIDTLYEAKTEIFARAAAPIADIFAHIPEDDAANLSEQIASDKTEFSRAKSRLIALAG